MINKTYYRGYFEKYPKYASRNSFIWITPNKEYAAEYGDTVVQFKINTDNDMIKGVTLREAEKILRHEFNYFNPCERDVEALRAAGVTYYAFQVNQNEDPSGFGDTCVCWLRKDLLMEEKKFYMMQDGWVETPIEKIRTNTMMLFDFGENNIYAGYIETEYGDIVLFIPDGYSYRRKEKPFNCLDDGLTKRIMYLKP